MVAKSAITTQSSTIIESTIIDHRPSTTTKRPPPPNEQKQKQKQKRTRTERRKDGQAGQGKTDDRKKKNTGIYIGIKNKIKNVKRREKTRTTMKRKGGGMYSTFGRGKNWAGFSI